MGLFYAYGVIIGSRDLEWLQGGINYFIRLFRRVILMTNVSKSKTMTCHPGEICIGISKEAFSQSSKEEGSTYRECLRRRIPCLYCRVDLTARYMMDHCRKLHGAEPEIEWDQLLFSHPEHLPLVYEVRFPTKMQSCQCPFPGCPRIFRSRIGLRNHFSRLHWGYSILDWFQTTLYT